MTLQELLDSTNKVVSQIQIQHRNTLNSNYNLHSILGEIKDFLMDFIDEIWEDIIISGGFAKFGAVSISAIQDRKENYDVSVDWIESYLNDLVSFYKWTTDLEIQNEYMAKAKELRKLYNKLKSVCPDMAEEESQAWEDKKEIKKPLVLNPLRKL